MTATIYINRQGCDCRKSVKKVWESMENASKDLEKANDHLRNAKYQPNGNARSTISSLKKNNNYDRDDFYSFADTLEQFVDKLIETDKERAKSIRSSGKSHRQKNGLPKSLTAASINASFNKMKDIVTDAFLDLTNWAADAVDWVCDRVKDIGEWIWENKTSLIQLASSIIQIATAVALVSLIPGWGFLGLMIGGCVFTSAVLGLDKAMGSVNEMLGLFESDGKSFTQHIAEHLRNNKDKYPKWICDNVIVNNYDLGYTVLDTVTSSVTSSAVGTLSWGHKMLVTSSVTTKLEKVEHLDKYMKFKKVEIANWAATVVSNGDEVIGFYDDVKKSEKSDDKIKVAINKFKDCFVKFISDKGIAGAIL